MGKVGCTMLDGLAIYLTLPGGVRLVDPSLTEAEVLPRWRRVVHLFRGDISVKSLGLKALGQMPSLRRGQGYNIAAWCLASIIYYL
jgi:hypothetical protein